MSIKRQATTDLNHENWDQEDNDEPEETEGFKMASVEVLEKRVRRTAKRRSNISNNLEKQSVFSGFGGFNKVQKTSFDFLANLTNGSKTNTDTSNKQEFTSNAFVSKPFSSGDLTDKQESSSPSLPAAISPSKEIQSSLFTRSGTSPPTGKSIFTDKKIEANTESPFKIQTASTPKSNFTFGTKSESNNNPTQQHNIFGTVKSISPNVFAPLISTPVKPVTTNASIFPSVTTNDKNSTEKQQEVSEEEIDKRKLNYYSKLKGLNISVLDWIKKHVDSTPLCILSPIFKDYEKHLKEVQDEYFNNTNIKSNGEKGDCLKQTEADIPVPITGTSLFFNSAKPAQEKPGNFIFGNSTGNTLVTSTISTTASTSTQSSATSFNSEQTVTKSSPGFKFGVNSTTTFTTSSTTIFPPSISSSGFIFGTTSSVQTPTSPNNKLSNDVKCDLGISSMGQKKSLFSTNANLNSNGSTPFSFGIGNKPFSFNTNIQNNETDTNETNVKEDEDEPPKVEYTPMVEENSVYDKKCKLFFKRDGTFVDKGVGTLYIKKIEDSGKHQLLIRANTNLGNVLLNLILSASIPTQRMGKNNVMLVCIPTPDTAPPPTPVLIRVKTSEEADSLLEILNKYKN